MADAAVSKTVGKPCEFDSRLGHHFEKKDPAHGWVLLYVPNRARGGVREGHATEIVCRLTTQILLDLRTWRSAVLAEVSFIAGAARAGPGLLRRCFWFR